MQINKRSNHSHFWIESCSLYESYNTIRGVRFQFISEILWPDTDFLNDAEMERIEDILNGIE